MVILQAANIVQTKKEDNNQMKDIPEISFSNRKELQIHGFDFIELKKLMSEQTIPTDHNPFQPHS